MTEEELAMEILILPVLLGLIPAAIAKSKGHNFIVWWLCGALLWIVALPCAICLKRSHADEKTCPACAEYVKTEAMTCRHCGHSFALAHVNKESSRAFPAVSTTST
jgi:Uncharacterised protein family UPF0547